MSSTADPGGLTRLRSQVRIVPSHVIEYGEADSFCTLWSPYRVRAVRSHPAAVERRGRTVDLAFATDWNVDPIVSMETRLG